MANAKTDGETRFRSLRILRNHLLIFGALLIVWEVLSATGIADELLFPRPSNILVSFARIFVIQGNIWWHLYVTLSAVVAGFVLGSTLGVGLGIATGLSATAREYLKPYIIVLEATPRIATGPLFIAWLGFGWSSKIAIVTVVCFFAPFINTLTGMVNVDEKGLEMFRSLKASRWQTFCKLQLPNALPIIMSGLRLAMTTALGGALVAEFISANDGIGVLLSRYTSVLNMPSSFATLLTMTAIGFLIYRLMEQGERHVVYWRAEDTLAAASRRRARRWKGTT